MKRFFFIPWYYSLVLFIGIQSYAQISFEKGYLINNNGEKKECLIKDVDWKNNPTNFNYRLFENADFNTASIDSVQEFGILDKTIYKRFIVKIDRSCDIIEEMSTSRDAVFKEETLFLKVLVEGKAKLYSYTDGPLIRFFFQIDSGNVDQLVFKSYKTSENLVSENQIYKQQLFVSLMCPQFSRDYYKSRL